MRLSLKEEDPFDVLGVPFEATDEEVRSAYFKCIRSHPPEKDPEGFKRVRQAFDKIKTLKERVNHVLSSLHEPPQFKEVMGGLAEREQTLCDEEIVAAVYSVTDLRRQSFHKEFKDLYRLAEEAICPAPPGDDHE